VKHSAFADQEGDQKTAEASVAIVNQKRQVYLIAEKASALSASGIKCEARNEDGFIERATSWANPVLSAPQFARHESPSAYPSRRFFVDLDMINWRAVQAHR
jgi:hypothetical protein